MPTIKVGRTPIPENEIIASSKPQVIRVERHRTFIDVIWNEEGTEVGSSLELISVLAVGQGLQKELRAKFPQAVFPQESDLFPGESEEAILIANAEAYHNLAFDLEDIDANIWNG